MIDYEPLWKEDKKERKTDKLLPVQGHPGNRCMAKSQRMCNKSAFTLKVMEMLVRSEV